MADNINTVNHRWIREESDHLSVAVDATCGGGNDTLFLSSIAERVIAMDIQKEAVLKTQKKTAECSNVELYCMDHSRMLEVVKGPVDLICFNLGYLPYSSVPLITSAKTTLPALEAARQCLKVGGILSVACYIGHPGGYEEWEAVKEWIEIHCQNWEIRTYSDGRENAPILYFMKKNRP